jgi:tetratricopeptide (TPR) repeat protein
MADRAQGTDRTEPIESLILSGPTPLAQLAQRARNSKSGAAMLQNTAHYLGEAAAALGAAFWFSRAVGGEGPIPAGLRAAAAAVALGRGPSFGAWVGLLRESASAAGGESLAALLAPLPRGGTQDALAATLDPELSPDGPFGSAADGLRQALREARRGGALGFLDFLVAFRNRAFGHGGMLPEAVCLRVAPAFLQATAEVLAAAPLFDGHRLGRTGLSLLDESGAAHWRELHGLAPRRLPPDAPGWPPADGCAAGLLHFVGDAGAVPLAPLVIEEDDPTGLSTIGFFQRAAAGRKRGAGQAASARALEYLSYVGGPFRSTSALASFAALQERLGAAPEGPEDERRETEPAASGERRFGDFVLLDEIGRGAMGIVHRARQASLGRTVALKVLPPALVRDAAALGRFQREVSVLARCDHPNVVHVLAYGVEEGRPWYAMELVEGADMSQAELPPGAPPRSARREWALRFAEAAEGLAEVHRQGVIHRDVKPANLMLARDGRRLVLMDLGLATGGEGTALTREGGEGFVGSPMYAAPEQLLSGLLPIDHRADLYGLGATMIEWFTGAPPYRADSVDALLATRLREDPPAPRRRDPTIPFDLDVILRKATAREPAERYASAADLAADLRAFAADRPIAARPPSRAYHLRMFYRRHKALVRVAAAAALLVTAVVAVAFAAVTAQRDRAVAAEADARRQRDRAEGLAGFVLFDITDRLRPLGRVDLLDAAARRALDYYDSVPAGGETDESARRRGVALVNIGEVLEAKGDLPKALEVFERALGIRERLAAALPDEGERLRERAEAIGAVARILTMQGNLPGALERIRERVAAAADLAARPGALPAWKREHAVALQQLGAALESSGDRDGAIEALRTSLDLLEAPASADDAPAEWRRDLSHGHQSLGDALQARNDPEGALAGYRTGLAISEALAASGPGNLRWQQDVAVAEARLGDALRARGDVEGALAAYETGLRIARTLAAADPGNAMRERELSTGLNRVGDARYALGDIPGAIEAYRELLAVAESLAARDPSNARWQRDLSIGAERVAYALEAQGNLRGALEAYRRSLEIRRHLTEMDATNVRWLRDLAISHERVGHVLLEQGDLAGAEESFAAFGALAERLAEPDPAATQPRRDLALLYRRRAELAEAKGDAAARLEARRAERTIAVDLSEGSPDNAAWRADRAKAEATLGDALAAAGDRDAAIAAYRTGLAEMERLLAADPDSHQRKVDLSGLLGGLGATLLARGDVAEASTLCGRALELAREAAEADPSNAERQRRLAEAWEAEGDARLARGDVAATEAAYREALAIAERLVERDPTRTAHQRGVTALRAKLAGIARAGAAAGASPPAAASTASTTAPTAPSATPASVPVGTPPGIAP